MNIGRGLVVKNLFTICRSISNKRNVSFHASNGLKQHSDNITAYVSIQNNIKPILGSLFMNFNVNNPNLNIKDSSVWHSISDPAVTPKPEVHIPIHEIVKNFHLPSLTNKELIDPNGSITEKKAHRMIRIRKRKMKKHKWKKLQKKMKFVFARIRRRRAEKREIQFMEELLAIIKSGEAYNPELEVEEKIEMLLWKRPLTHLGGYTAPQWAIDEHLEKKRQKAAMDERVEICLKKL